MEDASGYSNEIVIGGRDPSVVSVNQGPVIGLWLDDRSFTSGGKTGRSPLLIADLYDTNGINSYGLGIGHEIEAVVDNDRPHALVLNDDFVPEFGNYSRGTVNYKLGELQPGDHTLRLKAWDLFDNSSEKEIAFYIPENPEMTVKHVITAPNPMVDFTNFRFQPEQVDFAGVDVTIRIFDLYGRQVAGIAAGFAGYSTGSGTMEIPWDGTDESGRKLPTGLYPYKIIFAGRSGGYSETTQKLMIVR
jgi:hypothetical protein